MTAQSRILLVDNEPLITRPLRACLESTGRFKVREENDSLKVLATALEFRPDLVLLDVDMPKKDGGTVAAELRAHPVFKKTPIIFLTGIVTEDDIERTGSMIGGFPFIAKPVVLAELIKMIKKYL